jgi:hypothetical protein
MAIWLVALGALASWAEIASAQPAHSGVQYQTPTPTYENGSAPFAESAPPDHALNPFKPVGFEPEFDWFAPAETSSYGKGPKPNIGYFFSYERLYWSLAAPEAAYVGSQNNPYTNDPIWSDIGVTYWPNGPTLENRWIGATGAWGNRWEVGYTDVDDYGWMVSVLDHVSQGQYRIDHQPAFYFGDPARFITGTLVTLPPATDFELPYYFDEIRMKNILQLNGVEITRFYRARQLHKGAFFELLYGVRWFNLNDTFWVQADGNGEGRLTLTDGSFSLNVLDASEWSLRANNNLVGPQIGFRLFRQRQRWTTSVSARFLAAANFQNLSLKARLGSDVLFNPPTGDARSQFRGIGFDEHQYVTTFSPLGELRVDVAYNVTRSVGIKVGYTGLVVGNVSRASNSISYDAVNLLGIKLNNDQIFFANGVNFGVEINR